MPLTKAADDLETCCDGNLRAPRVARDVAVGSILAEQEDIAQLMLESQKCGLVVRSAREYSTSTLGGWKRAIQHRGEKHGGLSSP